MDIKKATTSIALSIALAFGGVSLATAPAAAQDGDDAKLEKRKNVDYYRVIYVKFKPGTRDAAWEILYEKFQPASEAAGNRFVALDFDSGKWSSAIYVPLPEGYGALEYSQSPRGKKFDDALAAQEGGEEAAAAVFKEWGSYIATSTNAIAHMHLQEKDDDGK